MEKIVKEKKESSALINEKIRAPQLQLITETGENIGTISRLDALRMAQQARLDLVQLNDQGPLGIPIAKIMDFGKSLYEKKKKESKKNQKVIQVKEIKIRPKIGEHDLMIKIKQSVQFLTDGKRVKITLCFRGRENVLKDELGAELFKKIEEYFEQFDVAKNLVQDKDTKLGQFWSRIYYLKNTK